jgi:hypothetical protein
MDNINSQEWEALYLRALQEPLGTSELAQHVKSAETAISRRIQELRASRNSSEERQFLANALRSLRYVRTEHFRHSAECGPEQLPAD